MSIRIGDLPIIRDSEIQNFCLHGTVGAGKSEVTSLTPSRCSVVQPRKREKASFPRFRRFRYYLMNGIKRWSRPGTVHTFRYFLFFSSFHYQNHIKRS